MPVRATSTIRSNSSSMTMGETPPSAHRASGPARFRHQRPPDGHLLALPARKLSRRLLGAFPPAPGTAQKTCSMVRALDPSSARMKAPISRFSSDRHRGEDVAVCGTNAIPSPTRACGDSAGDVVARRADAAAARRHHPEERLHRRRLARPVGPDDDRNFDPHVHADGAARAGCPRHHSRRSDGMAPPLVPGAAICSADRGRSVVMRQSGLRDGSAPKAHRGGPSPHFLCRCRRPDRPRSHRSLRLHRISADMALGQHMPSAITITGSQRRPMKSMSCSIMQKV